MTHPVFRTIFPIAFGLALCQCAGVREMEPRTSAGDSNPNYRVVSLYFLKENRDVSPPIARAAPIRWIRIGDRFHTRVVRSLLRGPNAAEREAGFYSEFGAEGLLGSQFGVAGHPKPLKAYLRSVRVDGRTATVDFSSPASHYLVNPAVVRPMTRTLLKLPEIDSVQFTVRGTDVGSTHTAS